MIGDILDLSRILVSLTALVYASWSDFKTREVSNSVWIILAPAAFLLTSTQFLFFPPFGEAASSFVYYGISFAVTAAFSIALFYAGAFGGADAKALMCIALALPLSPNVTRPLSGFVSPIFPITVFSNSVIIAALSVFYALQRNLLWKHKTGQRLFDEYKNASFGRKALAILCGYKVRVADLKRSFLYPLEDFRTTEAGELERHLLLFPKDEDREEIVDRIVKHETKPQNGVWATPGLPMLIFITLGLLVALTLGDVIWLLLEIMLA